MKFISDNTFSRIVAAPRTDFIFFIASSAIRRFCEHPHFQQHLAIPKGTITASTFSHTHRIVTDYYRQLLPNDTDHFIGQFSIKKGSNLYGLIFGSRHPKGIEKFLRVCWALDVLRGEANFDIDAENIDAKTPHLFPEMDRVKKVTLFQKQLSRRIFEGELKSDGGIYLHCLREGMLPKHGREVVSQLRKDKLIMIEDQRMARVSIKGYDEPCQLEVTASG